MSIGSILSWIVCGLVVGICARFLVPGRQYMSLTMTALLGIGGALLGGFLYSVIRGASVQPFSLASHNWYGWIVGGTGLGRAAVWMYPYAQSQKMVELKQLRR